MDYNNPKYFVYIAFLGSAITGACMPILGGLILAKLIAYLTVPTELLLTMYPDRPDFLKEEVNFNATMVSLLALVSFCSNFA